MSLDLNHYMDWKLTIHLKIVLAKCSIVDKQESY